VNPILLTAGLLLLPVTVVLDEAVLWFGRNALDAHDGEDDLEAARGWARTARRVALVSRLVLGLAFVLLFSAAASATPSARLAVLLLGLLWSLGAGALAGVTWRSPLGGSPVPMNRSRPSTRSGSWSTSRAGCSGFPPRTIRAGSWPPCTSSGKPAPRR